MQQLFLRRNSVDTQACHLLLVATKTHLPTPSVEVSTREVKRILSDIMRPKASLVIDQVLANSS